MDMDNKTSVLSFLCHIFPRNFPRARDRKAMEFGVAGSNVHALRTPFTISYSMSVVYLLREISVYSLPSSPTTSHRDMEHYSLHVLALR